MGTTGECPRALGREKSSSWLIKEHLVEGRVGSEGQLRERCHARLAAQVRHLAAWSVRKLGVPKQEKQALLPHLLGLPVCLLEAPP